MLDYVEFLESKYAERRRRDRCGAANPLSRFADAVEEKLRAGKVSATTIAETMSLMNKAVGVLNGAAAAGKSVANDLMTATQPRRGCRRRRRRALAVRQTPAGASGTTGATGAPAPRPPGGAAPTSGSGSGEGFNPT